MNLTKRQFLKGLISIPLVAVVGKGQATNLRVDWDGMDGMTGVVGGVNFVEELPTFPKNGDVWWNPQDQYSYIYIDGLWIILGSKE